MKYINLTQGKQAVVDDEDYDKIKNIEWHAQKNYRDNNYYALNSNKVGMHRIIMGIQNRRLRIDHKNGNGLDNRKENLRIATHQQNNWNCKQQKRNTSGYKGVSWHKRSNKFIASIGYNGRLIHLGYYIKAKDAALAYNTAAEILFNEFAKLNRI